MTFRVQENKFADIFDHPEFDHHERVVHINDQESGLCAIIAVHNTKAGPALGGCRMTDYPDYEAALRDALRLSRGMTYKNALAGIPYGGGKSVIIGNPKTDKTKAKLDAFAKALNDLGGRYITAEDSGMSVRDMDIVATTTPFVRGTSDAKVGDPSPFTARGVLVGIKAALKHKFGTDQLAGRTVAVQGLGNTGYKLCSLLINEGANLIVSDIDHSALGAARDEFNARVAPAGAIHRVEADVFSPCALGAILTKNTIGEIKASIVAGSANNQLATAADGRRLFERGILYAPDYVINAGGVIAIAMGQESDTKVLIDSKLSGIGDTLSMIFRRSAKNGSPESEIADQLALDKLAGLEQKAA